MSHIIQARQIKPWLQPDFLFHLLPYANEQTRCLSILHGFTDNVIKERKAQYAMLKGQLLKTENSQRGQDDDFITSTPYHIQYYITPFFLNSRIL